jgi:DNA-binding NarL/FixJ family response regulator
MPIKVLLAENNELMCKCIARLLEEEPSFELVGVATNFAQTMQMRADCKPKVLLMDLHLPDERAFTPAFVKSQLSSIRTFLTATWRNYAPTH